MKNIFSISGFLGLLGILLLPSCTKRLDLMPTNDVTSETVYSTPAGYKQVLAKIYGSMALTGNQGPAGNGDVQGMDEGFSDFYRLFWKAQELSTDEAVIAWGDIGIQDFHNMNWTSTNSFLTGLYYRSLYQVTLVNDFIRESTPEKLSARGISGAEADNIQQYVREAKFLRAYQYWVLMDLFGRPPMVTEDDVIGGPLPKQATRSEVFTFVESQLKSIEADMAPARTNEYGRADQGAVWALLARLYLNAEVYTGTARYADAMTYAKKVIDAGYGLYNDYRLLMRADNHNTNEFIFTINYDGLKTQGFGGTTFLSHAAVGGTMKALEYGIGDPWGGIRTTKNLVQLFPDVNGTVDKRAQFHTDEQSLEIANQTDFKQGYAITKFKNLKRDGSQGQSQDFADIDMPLFRLAEMYLVFAESAVRTNSQIPAAVDYINQLRQRAYGNTTGNIVSSQLTLDFILDERARELYWEGFRRTDLVRYNRFTTGNYLWPWKGGVRNGTAVADYRRLYPIPSRDINANTNLTQNPGY